MHLPKADTGKGMGQCAAVVRRAEGDELLDMRAAEAAQVSACHQAAHAVANEHDALRAGRGADRRDLGVELLREKLDVGKRRAVVDRIDGPDVISRQVPPERDPDSVIDQHPVDKKHGPFRASRFRVMDKPAVEPHQRP